MLCPFGAGTHSFQKGFFNNQPPADASIKVIADEAPDQVSYINPQASCDKWSPISSVFNDAGSLIQSAYLFRAAARMSSRLRTGNEAALRRWSIAPQDALAILYACAYERADVGQSNWCGVLIEEEILGFEEMIDRVVHSGYGPGLPNGMGQLLGGFWMSNFTSRITDTSATPQNMYIE